MRSLIVALLLLTACAAQSCSCVGGAAFLNPYRGELVIDGVVRSYVTARQAVQPAAMNVDVHRVLSGHYGAKSIRIFGDFGMSCVPYVSNFPIGTEWVFAITGPVEISGLGDENFGFMPCSTGWLAVIDGHASGVIASDDIEVSLDDLATVLSDPTRHVETHPPFASVRSSTDAAIRPPSLRGSSKVTLATNCTGGIHQTNVDLVIDATGAVRRFMFQPNLPSCIASALWAAVQCWRFDPASVNGVSIAVRHRVTANLQ